MINTIKVAKQYDTAKLPTRKHPTDAGLDLYICHGHGGVFKPALKPGEIAIYGTGITMEIAEGYAGFIKPKSRSNFAILGGVVDAGYQGEILVKVVNISRDIVMVSQEEAIAQMVIEAIETPTVVEVSIDEIHQEKSERGATGGIINSLDNNTTTWQQEQFFASNLTVE